MSKYFSVLVISFFPIFITNIVWAILAILTAFTEGMEFILQDRTIFETIATGAYLRWILLIDAIWIISFTIYFYSRKKFRTETSKHFLQYDPIENPKICVVIPAFNEEATIQKVVNGYVSHKFVRDVIVIDNHSDDKTVELARQSGAKVITKKENRGLAHSWVMCLREALNTDANLIVLSEADGTLSGSDLDKMLPYITHCDVIHGSRQVQILTEDGNLRQEPIHVWGNYILSKLIQLKYLNLVHLGIVNLNDVGTGHRMFRRKALEETQNQFTYPGSDKPVSGFSFPFFITMKLLEKDFRILEIPITFKKRVGESKAGSRSLLTNLKSGFFYIGTILKY